MRLLCSGKILCVQVERRLYLGVFVFVCVCVTFSQKVGHSNNKGTRVHKLVACQQRTYRAAGLPSGHLVSVEPGVSVQ
jgi:hypothetical protein